jgi:hypothetical protein
MSPTESNFPPLPEMVEGPPMMAASFSYIFLVVGVYMICAALA